MVVRDVAHSWGHDADWSCLTVPKGDYEPTWAPFYGFHSAVMTASIRMAVLAFTFALSFFLFFRSFL